MEGRHFDRKVVAADMKPVCSVLVSLKDFSLYSICWNMQMNNICLNITHPNYLAPSSPHFVINILHMGVINTKYTIDNAFLEYIE